MGAGHKKQLLNMLRASERNNGKSENGWRQQLQGRIAADATEWHTEKGLN